jgi:acetylglutamate kinase
VGTTDQFRVDILSESLPFIQKLWGKTIVVKYGGAAMKSQEHQASVVNDLVLFTYVGLHAILIHGGGPEINQWLKRVNIPPIFHEGLCVNDSQTMEIVYMVLVGKVNKHLVSLINRAGTTVVRPFGMDDQLLIAQPSPKSQQLGFIGKVARVDPTVLRSLIANGHILVVTSVAADESGQPYNINTDMVARELAATLGAKKLILLTDTAGILEDKEDLDSLVKRISINGVKRMVEEGKVVGGMIPKVHCYVRSLAQGIRTTNIIDGRVPHSLLSEIMTDKRAGTMITE